LCARLKERLPKTTILTYIVWMLDVPRPPNPPVEHERAINAPTVVIVLIAVFVIVQAVRSFLSPQMDFDLIVRFSFLPVRYDAAALNGEVLPGGLGADIWTFVTYAFLHGDWVHLLVNAVWLLAFGSAVAWRFGGARFLLFSLFCTIAGAATHLAFHFGEAVPVVGASAAISGHMAGAIRFVFQPGAPLGFFRIGGSAAFRVPAHPLKEALRDGRVLGFLVVWVVFNVVFGLGAIGLAGEGQSVAWEAHFGGFLAGLLLFPLFDPIRSPH
jgi:membrane associated rhomboid family serine protease